MHVSEANRIVYLKKKARNQGTNFPGDAAGGLCGVALITMFFCENERKSWVWGRHSPTRTDLWDIHPIVKSGPQVDTCSYYAGSSRICRFLRSLPVLYQICKRECCRSKARQQVFFRKLTKQKAGIKPKIMRAMLRDSLWT